MSAEMDLYMAHSVLVVLIFFVFLARMYRRTHQCCQRHRRPNDMSPMEQRVLSE